MNRKQFLKYVAALPIAGGIMSLYDLFRNTKELEWTEKMPVMFLGHGSPMIAIEENQFVQGFRRSAISIPKPKAILCISAHWETNGTLVTAMNNPKTIHDFGGFPQELYDVQYPAPGSPSLASETKELVKKTEIKLDHQWGLDHGAWSVIKHLYPNADIPVIQMSIDYTKDPLYHYELAKELHTLRNKGILIIGSGNMVHNLGLVDWSQLNTDDYGFDWTKEASVKMKEFILNDQHTPLINYRNQGKSFQLAVPTPEHYLPLLYVLALKEKKESIELFNDKMVGGSLTMTSVKIS